LQRVSEIFSNTKHNNSFAEVLELALDYVIAKRAPDREVKRKTKSKVKKPSVKTEVGAFEALVAHDVSRDREDEAQTTQCRPATGWEKSYKRENISPWLVSQVHKRDKGRCSYVSPITGIRCGHKYRLQIDHILPVAHGGKSTLENLRLLCQGHNLSEAKRLGLLH
jgi:hypothetical protein